MTIKTKILLAAIPLALATVFFLIPKPQSSFAAAITSTQSGNWNATSTWSGGVVPGNGDTVTIANGNTVTVNDTRIVGISTTTTAAINLSDSGALIIASGGVLKVRGDVTYTSGGSNTATSTTIQAGGEWQWDASAATSPSATHFSFYQNGDLGYRPFVAVGNSGSHAKVDSNASGGNGYFGVGGHNYGGIFNLTYTDVSRIGTASLRAFEQYDLSNAIYWTATHSTFDSCGQIYFGQIGANSTLIHDYNVHTNSLGNSDGNGMFYLLDFNTSPGTGVLEMKNNVFDIQAGDINTFIAGGMTIANNYFGDYFNFSSSAPWASATNNFFRQTSTTTNIMFGLGGDISNAYFFADSDHGNPHVLQNGATITIDSIIWGQAGASPLDSGEFIDGPGLVTVKNSIFLPNMTGYSSLEISVQNAAFGTYVANNNTWFGGYSVDATGGFAAEQMSEGSAAAVGQLQSFKNNILWNPALVGYSSNFLKVADISGSSTPVQNICSPTACDYNAGFNNNATSSGANSSFLTNQGNGYAAKFSSAPGTHDVNVNPQFVDYQRSVELFDSKYLGNSPVAWNSGSSYSIGDFVSSATSTVYWGLIVNYRYINSGTCSSANPQPGSGTNWRNCWEWASLYRMRTAIAAGTTYTDATLGLTNADVIQTVMAWIRYGYRPQNIALHSTASDGGDIGAEPWLGSTRTLLGVIGINNGRLYYTGQ